MFGEEEVGQTDDQCRELRACVQGGRHSRQQQPAVKEVRRDEAARKKKKSAR